MSNFWYNGNAPNDRAPNDRAPNIVKVTKRQIA
jgi:hypothetical protein